MKIFTKILLSLVVMTSILFTSLYLLLQWSFDEGMLNYINQREIQSLELLAENLVKVNEEIGDLTLLKRNAGWWHEIISLSRQGKSLESNPISKIKNALLSRDNVNDFPPHRNKGARPPREHHQRRPPPNGFERPENSPSHLRFRQDKPPHTREQNGNGPTREPTRERKKAEPPKGESFTPSRIPSLLGTDKKIIIGRYNNDFSLLPIKNTKKVIGYLALPPAKKLTSSFDLAFSESQRNTWLYILFAVFTLTFLVAVLLSRYLVQSIQKITLATHQLNSGDYKIKLLPHGKDELAMLARNFNDLAQTLSQNDYSRKAWLADISHELRTPLAIMKGEIEALQDGIRQITPESLQSLADEINHLQKLISDLNQLSNADVGAMSYQKSSINLTNLLTQNIHRWHTDIDSKNITLSTQFNDEMFSVWADETRLNQLLDNLITNSLKYTDSPGKISISLKQKKCNAVLIIEDSSPSVPTDAIDKLFDHLFRVENSRNRKTGGSGLGLALCKKIVEAHQGEISAYQSNIGGLAIKISFPLL